MTLRCDIYCTQFSTRHTVLHFVSKRRWRIQADRFRRLGPPSLRYLGARDSGGERSLHGAHYRSRENLEAALETGKFWHPGTLALRAEEF